MGSPVQTTPVESHLYGPWVWRIRGSAATTGALVALLLGVLWSRRQACTAAQAGDYLLLVVLLLPYGLVLWRLRRSAESKGAGLAARIGLWGVVLSVVFWFFLDFLVPFLMEGLALGVLAAAIVAGHLALGVTGWKTFRALRAEGAEYSRLRAVAATGGYLVLVLAVWVVVVGPRAGEERAEAGARIAVPRALQWIQEAQEQYAGMHPEEGFAGSFEALAEEELIPIGLVEQHWTGYQFALSAGERGENGRLRGYTVSARPGRYGRHGCRSFLLEESGAIYYTSEDREATAEDPPLQ
ncbi:MAG: hypothetical protein ACE5G6_02025 [Terriglobia bacterium]